jgi:hypothetical protein
MVGSLLFGKTRKRGQGVAPHRIDVGAQLREACGIETKVVTGASPLFLHQANRFEDLEVLGDGGPADGKTAGEFADGRGPLPEQV